MWNSSRRSLWSVVSGIARRTGALHEAGQTTATGGSILRWKSSLPEDISNAAKQARFAARWTPKTNFAAETTQQGQQKDEQREQEEQHKQQQDVVSSFMFPWEKRQMQGGALSTWEKYYWGVFVMAIAVFLFSKAGHWMSKDPAEDEEERRRNEEVERQKRDKARRVLIGASMLEDEDDPFDGLSPEEIQEFVQDATGANAKDPFEGCCRKTLRHPFYRRSRISCLQQQRLNRDIYGSLNASASDDLNEAWKPALESIDDMSSDIIERYLEMFEKADTDNNGVLDKNELRAVLESVGDGTESLDVPWLTDDDLESILSQYDKDKNGVIDQEEFRRLAEDNVFLTRALKDYKAMFDALDTGGNGVIGPTELYQFFERNVDSSPSDQGSFEHVCSLISRYDLNNDGVISFPEFLRLCRYERALPLDEILAYASTVPAVVADPVVVEEYTSPYESGMVHMITSKDEFVTALEGEKGKRMIVLFGSLTWCRPCKKIQPQLEKIAKAYPDVLFLKLYGNESDQTKSFFKDDLKVRVTPSFFFFQNGELVGSCTGANPTTVETQMRKLLGTSGSTPMLYP